MAFRAYELLKDIGFSMPDEHPSAERVMFWLARYEESVGKKEK